MVSLPSGVSTTGSRHQDDVHDENGLCFIHVIHQWLSEINAPVGSKYYDRSRQVEEICNVYPWEMVAFLLRCLRMLDPTCTKLLSSGGNPSLLTSLPWTQRLHYFMLTQGGLFMIKLHEEFRG